MSRAARARRLSAAVSAEASRILGRLRRPRRATAAVPARAARDPWFACDPLEERILFALTVDPLADRSTAEGTVVNVQATLTDTDSPSSTYSACINWGDGSTTNEYVCASYEYDGSGWVATHGVINSSHVYRDDGSYTATVWVGNGYGTEYGYGTAQSSFAVTVANVAPNLTIGGGLTTTEGGEYTLNLASNDPGLDTIQHWDIDWGDGTSVQQVAGNPPSVTHTFAPGATRPRVTAKATDEDGTYDARVLELDQSFNGTGVRLDAGGGVVRGIAVQSDGRIVVARDGVGGNFGLARYTTNGTPDPTFGDLVNSAQPSGPRTGYTWLDFSGSGSSDLVGGLVIQHVNGEDAIVLAGGRSSSSTDNDFAMVRFHADGTLDTSFGPNHDGKVSLDFAGGYDFAYGVVLQGDKIVLAGSAAQAPGSANFDTAVARFTAAGQLDTTFGTGGKTTFGYFAGTADNAYALAITPGTNSIILAGTAQSGGTTGGDFAVARLTAGGQLDGTFGRFVAGTGGPRTGMTTVDFGPSGDTARSVTIQADGKVVVAGGSASGSGAFAVARLNADGSLDDGSTAADADGPDPVPADRFGANGRVTTGFAFNTDGAQMVAQVDGRLVVVGRTFNSGTSYDFAVARYMPDGSLDPTLGTGGKLVISPLATSNSVDRAWAVAVQADGRILVGGSSSASSTLVRYQPGNQLYVTVLRVAPGGLQASNVTDTSADLTWTDNSAGETGFRIEVSTDLGATWSTLGTTAANVTAFTATGLDPATNYRFRVRAVDAAVNGQVSAPSNEVSVDTADASDDTMVRIEGPDYGTEGTLMSLRAAGLTTADVADDLAYYWSVARLPADGSGGNPVPVGGGRGSRFAFTPADGGAYEVTLTVRLAAGGQVSVRRRLDVVNAAPTVRVVGRDDVVKGAGAIYSAVTNDPGGASDGRTYAWSVYSYHPELVDPEDPDPDAHSWVPVALPAGTATNLSSFLFVPSEDADHEVRVTVTDKDGAAVEGRRRVHVQAFASQRRVVTRTPLDDDSPFPGGTAEVIAVQRDGKILLGGYETDVSSGYSNWVVMRLLPELDADGNFQVDRTFGDLAANGTDHKGYVRTLVNLGVNNFDPWYYGIEAMAVQEDGKIVAAGTTLTQDTSGIYRDAITVIRYTADGQLDAGFGAGGFSVQAVATSSGGNSVAVDPEGRIVAGGWAKVSGAAATQFAVVRLLDDGTPDPEFGDDQTGAVTTPVTDTVSDDSPDRWTNSATSVLIDPQGNIVAAGSAQFGESYDVWTDFVVVRYTSGGAVDTSFGGDGLVSGHDDLPRSPDPHDGPSVTYASLLPDGSIAVAGGWSSYESSGWQDNLLIAKLGSSGVPDTNFGDQGQVIHAHGEWGILEGFAVQDDGRFVVSLRYINPPGGSPLTRIFRVNADGSPDDGSIEDSTGDDQFADETPAPGALPGTVDTTNVYPGGVAVTKDGIFVVGSTGYGTSDFTLIRYQQVDAGAMNLRASADAGEPAIDLAWDATGRGSEGYEVLRSTSKALLEDVNANSFNALRVGYAPADAQTFVDRTAVPGQPYYYRVFGLLQGQRKNGSNIAFAQVAPPNTQYVWQKTIRVPVDGSTVSSQLVLEDGKYYRLRASGEFALSRDHLTDPSYHGPEYRADAEYGLWSPRPYDTRPDFSHVDYGVEVADSGAPAGTRAPYWGPVSTADDHGYTTGYLGTGHMLSLRYRDDYYGDNERVDTNGDGVPDAPYLMRVDVYRALPATPSQLVALPKRETGTAELAWQNNAIGADSVTVERSVDGGPFAAVATLAGNATSFTDAGLSPDSVYTYRVYAHDPFGDSPYSTTVDVILPNAAPRVGYVPPQSAQPGQAFEYVVAGTDEDPGDAAGLTFALTDKPDADMQVDPATGVISWPSAKIGKYVVGVRVTDAHGAWSERRFSLVVPGPRPAAPVISAVTADDGTVTGISTTLRVTAAGGAGATGDLTYSWRAAVPTNGAMPSFTADHSPVTQVTFGRAGVYTFSVTVTQDGLSTTASVRVAVVPTPTSLTASADYPLMGHGQATGLSADVCDQFGQPIDPDYPGLSVAWSLDQGSTAGGTVVGATFTATSGAGPALVHAEASIGGRSAGGSVTVQVSAAAAPVISAVAASPLDTATRSKVTLTATADSGDPANPALTYAWSVVTKPANAPDPAFAAPGAAATDVTFAASGAYQFRLTVTNAAGLSERRTVDVDVQPQLRGLTVAEDGGQVAVNGTRKLHVRGYDQFGRPADAPVGAVTWQVAGDDPATHPNGYVDVQGGQFVYHAPAGERAVELTVTATGVPQPLTVRLRVVPKVETTVQLLPVGTPGRATDSPLGLGGDVSPPSLDADEPVRAVVTGLPGDELPYRIDAYPTGTGAADPILIRAGTVDPSDGPDGGIDLGSVSPTLLPEGTYKLRLTVGTGADARSVEQTIQVKSELKLGNFSLPASDLSVPAAGLPLSIGRVYDTLRTNKDGLFGPGWRVEFDDVDLRVTAVRREKTAHVDALYPTFYQGDALYVTLPGGQQEAFEFAPVPFQAYNQQGLYVNYWPSFKALNGTGSTLKVAGDVNQPEANRLKLVRSIDSGELSYLLVGGPKSGQELGYNPTRPEFGGDELKVVTRDGTVYRIKVEAVDGGTRLVGRVLDATDAAGNRVVYNRSLKKVQHFMPAAPGTSGTPDLELSYTTDGGGRITKITDPKGAFVEYHYDPATGDLIGVTDRNVHDTTYGYTGRLSAYYDGPQDSVYAVIRRTMDQRVWASGDFVAEDPAAWGTYKVGLGTWVDGRWHLGGLPADLPADVPLEVTYYVKAGGQPAASDRKLGTESHAGQETRGHYLVRVTDARGVTALSATYDPQTGKLTDLKDVYKKAAPFGGDGFDGQEARRTVTDLAGNDTEMVYDKRGSVVRELRQVKDPVSGKLTGYEVTVHTYDYADDDPTDALKDGGLGSQVDYEPFFVPVAAGYGRYTQAATKIRQVTNYDLPDPVHPEQGRTVTSTEVPDPAGGPNLVTRYGEYVLGRPQIVTDPYGVKTYTKYDAKTGRVIWTLNALGEGTLYEYVPDGNPGAGQVSKTWRAYNADPATLLHTADDPATPDHEDLPDALDAAPLTANTYFSGTTATSTAPGSLAGMLWTTTDFAGVKSRYTYYADGKSAEVFREWTDAQGNSKSVRESLTEYDPEGRVIATTDEHGHTTTTSYDELGRADDSRDVHGNHTFTTYDARGNVIETRSTHQLAAHISGSVHNADGSVLVTTAATHGLSTGDAVTITTAGVRTTWQITVPDATSFVLVGSTSATPSPVADDEVDVTDTVTRTAYDAMGRAEWTVDGYKPGSPDLGANGTHTFYDAQGRAWKTQRLANVVIAIEEDPDPAVAGSGIRRSRLDTTGAVLSSTSTQFDDQGRVAAQTAADGHVTTYTYWPDGSQHTVTQVLRTTRAGTAISDHDARGLNTLAVGGSVGAGDVFTVTFKNADGTGADTITVTASGGATGLASQLVTLINAKAGTSSPFAKVQASLDSDGLRVHLTSRAAGAAYLCFVSVADNTPSNSAAPAFSASLEQTTTYSFELVNDPTAPTGTTRKLRQDVVADASGHTTRTLHDVLGREIKTTYNDGTHTDTLYGVDKQPVDGHTVTGQTITGQQVTKIDQMGVATDYFYDPQGRLTDAWQPAVKDALNVNTLTRPHWHYDYDPNGNLTAIVDPQDDSQNNKPKQTKFTYNDYNQRTDRKLPGHRDGVHGEYEHDTYTDSYGRLTTHKDFKGNVTEYVYDDSTAVPEAERVGLGRVVYKKYRDPTGVLKETVHYTYDALGRTLTATDGTGVTSYEYDADGRTTKVVSPQGTVHHRYDPTTGRLVETWTGPDKGTPGPGPTTDTLYGYDELGRLASVSSAAAAMTGGPDLVRHERYDATGRVEATAANNPLPTTLYAYDPAGNLDTVTLPNGIVTDYDYDALYRLTKETIKRPNGTKEQTYDYTLLDDGTRDHVVETRYLADGATPFSTVRVDWAYDALGRLTQEKRDEGNDRFGTDNQPDAGDYLTRYDYDLAGNRIHQKTDHGADGDHTVAGETDASFDDVTTYDYVVDSVLGYNADDRLYSTTEDSGGTETITTYAYDPNGSTTGKSTIVDGGAATTVKYVYDARSRLVRLDANGDTQYDASGNPLPASQTGDVDTAADDTAYVTTEGGDRVAVTTNGQTTTFLTDNENPTGYGQTLEERVNGVLSRSYVLGSDVIAQADAAGSLEYLLYDGHGSTRMLADAAGYVNPAARYDYDAFGNGLGFDMATAATSLLYSGERYDSGLKQQFLRDRYYDQAIGRFSSFDFGGEGDTGSPLSLHRYAYGDGNPVQHVDPSGQMSEGEALVVSGIIAMMATLTVHSVYSNASSATIAYSQGNYLQGTRYLEQEIMSLLSLSFGGGRPAAGIGPQLQAVNGAIQAAQTSVDTAAALASQYLQMFASSLSSFGGHKYVKRTNASERDVTAPDGRTVRIVGQSGSSSTTDGHKEAIDALAEAQAKEPGTLMVFLQRSLRTVTGREPFATRDIPDVVVVRMNNPNDITRGIKIDLYEVWSNSQTPEELNAKLNSIMNQIPEPMQGKPAVLPPLPKKK